MSDAETATASRRGRPPKAASAESRLPPVKLPPYRLAKVAELIGYKGNPMQHPPAQIDLLVKLIREFGWTNPVLVDGKHGVIAGHGRLEAARKMGLETVPTIELRHLTAAQKRAYIIADNESARKGKFDSDLLAIELRDLDTDGFDLELTGLDLDDVDALLGREDENFAPGSADDQGKLDERAPVTCPHCGHSFPPP